MVIFILQKKIILFFIYKKLDNLINESRKENSLKNFHDGMLLNEKKNGWKFLYSKGESIRMGKKERRRKKGLEKVSARIKCFKVLSFSSTSEFRNMENSLRKLFPRLGTL